MFGILFSIKNFVFGSSVWWSGESYGSLWGTEKSLTKIPIQHKWKIFMEENSSVIAHTAGLHFSQNTPTTNCIFVQWRHLVAASLASSERKICYLGKLFSCWDLITTLSHSIFMISLGYKWDLFDLQMVI